MKVFSPKKVIFYILEVIGLSIALFFFSILIFWVYLLAGAIVFYLFSLFLALIVFLFFGYFSERKKYFQREEKILSHFLQVADHRRLKAEKERDFAANILFNFSEGLLAAGGDDKVFFINKAAEKYLGIKARDILKTPLQNFKKFAPFKDIYFESLQNKPFKKNVNINGNEFKVSFDVLNSKKGGVEKIFVFYNVSEQKKQDAEKATLILSLVHKLRTAITAEKWSLKMLLSEDFGLINREQKAVISELCKKNEILSATISELANIEKLESSVNVLNKSFCDIGEIVRGVAVFFKDEIRRKKIKIDFQLPKYFEKIKFDKEKLATVLQILFDNAIKYTPERGLIRVYLKKNGREAEFSIADQGPGIPENERNMIFTKFFRGENAKGLQQDGFGVGLFLAKNIIEAHGGKIWFESKEGEGATFCFSLPTK